MKQSNHHKDITPIDKEWRPHGHWIEYHDNGQIKQKGTYYQSHPYGYHVCYNKDGLIELNSENYWIDGDIPEDTMNNNPNGYCIIWNRRKHYNGRF
jgi:antitoxin component YwqK of YwqJK toxin-antitoxin module